MNEGPTEVKGFYKTKEGFILNTDKTSLLEYKAQKLKNQKLNRMEEELSQLKSDISEIKDLLKGLVK